MRFGLFGGARTEIGEQASDSQIYTDYVDYICEAEELGFHSVFLVEHHFTGFGQISATLSFLTYLAAKTSRMRLAPRFWCCPGTIPLSSPNKLRPWIFFPMGGSISASAKVTAGASSTVTAFLSRKPASAMTRRWRFCARLRRRKAALRINERACITKESSSSQRPCRNR